MRSIIAILHISLDGVIQGPGGPQEDPSGGFIHGGWIARYADEQVSATIRAQMALPFDLLLGRKTFDIWAPYWPNHPDIWPSVNAATKYVVSNTLTAGPWNPAVFLGGDVPAHIRQLKQQDGPDLHVYGSAHLLQTLMQHDLVDGYWLRIYPLVLGTGKRLFAGGAVPADFQLTEHRVSPKGVILASYQRARG
jgi:dihydrofolate reductase